MRNKLAGLLERRGYKLAGESNSGKIVKKFEREGISEKLFEVIKSEQIFRVIGYFLFGKAVLNVDNLSRDINKSNLKYAMNESIVKKAVCVHCGNEILFPKFDSEPNIICQSCSKKDYRVEDDWDLDLDIYCILIYYLNKLKTEGMLSKNLEVYCPICLTKAEYFEESKLKKLRTFKKKLFCEKCDNFKEVKWVYTTPESVSNFWEKNGIWLEWYVKNLLSTEGIDFIQGIKVKNKNGEEIEVDGLLSLSDKIISIECKVKSFNNTYNEESGISKLFSFSDYVIFITTTKISDSLKSRYKKISTRCKKIFVDGSDIERLPLIINEIQKTIEVKK